MASFGARYIRFAPITAEPADAMPNYGEAVEFGGLSKAELTVQTAVGTIYGDDQLDEKVELFSSGTLNVETTDMSLEAQAAIFGSEYDEQTKELVRNASDIIPYGGITYIKTLMRKKQMVYKTYFLPKVQAGFSTDSANTKGESITLGTTPSTFTVFEPNTGDWCHNAEFTGDGALADAMAWCDGKLAAALPAAAQVSAGDEAPGGSETE